MVESRARASSGRVLAHGADARASELRALHGCGEQVVVGVYGVGGEFLYRERGPRGAGTSATNGMPQQAFQSPIVELGLVPHVVHCWHAQYVQEYMDLRAVVR